jgi:hypothetical protein
VILESALKTRSRDKHPLLRLVYADGEAPAPGRGRKVNEWLDDGGNIYAQLFRSEDLRWIDWSGLGVFSFATGCNDVRVWLRPGVRREAVLKTFSGTIQAIILQGLGWQALHAAASIGPAGVLAFCGSKGSGKSTLAFAMHQAGWPQFADDALVLRLDQDRVRAVPLSFAPRLRPASRAQFARAGRLDSLPPRRAQPADVRLSSMFVLEQNARLTNVRVSLIRKARAFSELLPHAHCFDAEDQTHKRQLVNDYLELIARVPVFLLEYRPDFRQLPRLIRAVMEAASGVDADAVFSSELRPAVLPA